MQEPKLRNCPFCGGPAMLREFGHHIDPYTGAHEPDIRVGCSAAFTAHGDWGDDHKRCPVAPMIESRIYPGIDIVAAWNRRANGGQVGTPLDASAKRMRAAGRLAKRQVKEAPHDAN